MIEVTRVTLENEMDIVLAHKQMMQVAALFSLTLSTRTTISAAVAEISRVVIDKTDSGVLIIGISEDKGKHFLTGDIRFSSEIDVPVDEDGLMYAKKLVPEFNFSKDGNTASIIVSIGIPRSFKITRDKILDVNKYFKEIKPGSPYEELKIKNSVLNLQARQQEEQLQQSRYLDEKKNEFISIASHELKTPLTSIKAFTKLALDAGVSESSQRVLRYLEKINGQAGKLQLLIQQLLDVSKIESGKLDYNMQTVVWNDYVHEVISILEQMIPSHPIIWEPCEQNVTVMIDALRIEQVFTNLVTNAAKYSSQDSAITIQCIVEDGVLCISVIDEGIGIAEENLAKIFEKYFRESAVIAKYSGFGMGLYISADIIAEHGGKIWALRNEQEGSTFRFTLPVLPD